MMEIEQLWKEIDERVRTLPVCSVGLQEALHRVVVADVLSDCDLPGFDQSAMDGFAFASAQPGSCRIVGSMAAGEAPSLRVSPGIACRILTGAVIPDGTECVAKQEDCTVAGDQVALRTGVSLRSGENIRWRGGVLRKNDILMASGTRVTAGGVALLASAGVERVPVAGGASVLHLVTGDEILAPGSPLRPGQIYDSNGPMIRALFDAFGFPVESVRLPDGAAALIQKICASTAEILLISGGSGPGDRDHTLGALESGGFVIHSSRLNSRPGKPLIFATKNSRIAFGLPGNPLSHWVCFQAFVKRAICRLQGLPVPEMRKVRLEGTLQESDDPRRTWTPGMLEIREGRELVRPLPWRHSGDLTPIVRADALILGADANGVADVMTL